MTYDEEHYKMVANLAKDGNTIKNEMTGDEAHLIHMCMGISGEAGELLDAIKKHVMYRKDLDLENVIEELGDLEFYMCGLRQGLGIARNKCLDHNINKLSKGEKARYKDGYTDQAAQDRVDKQ